MFETTDVHRVQASTDSRNQACSRMLEKIGMKKEGLLRSNRRTPQGSYIDEIVYAILKSDWNVNFRVTNIYSKISKKIQKDEDSIFDELEFVFFDKSNPNRILVFDGCVVWWNEEFNAERINDEFAEIPYSVKKLHSFPEGLVISEIRKLSYERFFFKMSNNDVLVIYTNYLGKCVDISSVHDLTSQLKETEIIRSADLRYITMEELEW
jgi:hypothetical protein